MNGEHTNPVEPQTSNERVYTYSESQWAELRDYAIGLQKQRDELREKLKAVTKWLEKHQPDVFRRGLWDAIDSSSDETTVTPVAWRYKDTRGHWRYTGSEPKPEHAILQAEPLYATNAPLRSGKLEQLRSTCPKGHTEGDCSSTCFSEEPRETTGPQPIGDYVLLSDMGETNVQGYGNCLFATHDAVKSPTHQETVLVDRTALLEWRAERAAEFLEDAPVTAKEVLSGNYDHEFRPTVETTEHLHWCAIRIDKTCNCRPVEPSGVLPPAFQSLLDLQPNWDSYGAKRINLACVQKAYEIWRQLAGIWLPVPHSDGTVGLEQHQGGFDIEIDVDLSLPPEKSSESSPDQLVGALQDRVHQDLGRVRAGRSVKVHKENCQKRLTGELNFKELSACDCDAEKASGHAADCAINRTRGVCTCGESLRKLVAENGKGDV